jgi:hypothetical protein
MCAERSIYDLDGVFMRYQREYGAVLYTLVPADQAAPAPAEAGQFAHYPDHPLPSTRGNTAEAQRQARVWERALQLLELGYSYEPHSWFDTWLIYRPGRLTPSYEVCPHTWRCACPDFRGKGGYCKHTLAVYVWLEACKRDPRADNLVISSDPAVARERHRKIARFVRKVAAELFKAA